MNEVEKFLKETENFGKQLKLIVEVNYSKIELVHNTHVQEDGKIGAELSELKLEELDKLDDGHNLIVTDIYNSKIICEYHDGSLREIRTFKKEEHLFLFPVLYVIRNQGLYS